MVEQYRDDITRLAPDLPPNFVLSWMRSESGGNPCSTGLTEPNRFEAGIFQLMFPQDGHYGATLEQLRRGCSGQMLVDPSAVDRDAQISSGLNLIRDYVGRTQQALAQNGVSWSPSSSDFWKAVKSIHGLPCIMSDLLPRVVQRFGPPSSWDDFRNEALSLSPSEMGAGCGGFAASPSVHGNRNRLEDIFDNAEAAGKWGGGILGNLPVSGGSLVVAAAAGLFLVALWRRRRART